MVPPRERKESEPEDRVSPGLGPSRRDIIALSSNTFGSEVSMTSESRTLENICRELNCQPGDLLSYQGPIPED
jgi:hypothetical protein